MDPIKMLLGRSQVYIKPNKAYKKLSKNSSMVATRQLLKAGFKAENIDGGMLAWDKAGLPVKKGNA